MTDFPSLEREAFVNEQIRATTDVVTELSREVLPKLSSWSVSPTAACRETQRSPPSRTEIESHNLDRACQLFRFTRAFAGVVLGQW